MQYNTQQKKMALPEYGRAVQNMVDHALTIENREERQKCANTIINIMGNMFPHLRDVPDFNHKLWDHLAIMADFKLDIDYPYEVVRKESLDSKPNNLPYPNSAIKYRHYGRTLQDLIEACINMEDGEEKLSLTALICNHMHKDYVTWNKDVDDRKIASDLEELSGGKLTMTQEVADMMRMRMDFYSRPVNKTMAQQPNRQVGNKQNNGKRR